MSHLDIQVGEASLQLLAEKAIYWPAEKILMIADLHFGKVTHFRKAGLAVPKGAIDKNWEIFTYLLLNYEVERVLFLGDLFHSDINTEWIEFKKIIQQFPAIDFELVVGNHDIFDMDYYKRLSFKIYKENLRISPFLFTHKPLAKKEIVEGHINVCGHIHPSVRLYGKGKQSLRLACFYLSKQQFILPAFGSFTGTYTISPKKGDHVYAIAADKVIKV